MNTRTLALSPEGLNFLQKLKQLDLSAIAYKLTTYTFPISVFILMMLGTQSFGISSAFGFASAPIMEAVRTPNVEGAKAENVNNGEDDDVDDRDDTVPTR